MDEKKLKTFIINGLRQASYRYPVRAEARRAGKIAYGRYRCNICSCEDGPKAFQIDHIMPVVAVDKPTDWNDYISRMFCKVEDLQLLCIPCHKKKTQKENSERRAYIKNNTVKKDSL